MASSGRPPCGDVLHDLQERVKELTALHSTARLLQDEQRPVVELLADVVALIPPAWQYPEITCARVLFDGAEVQHRGLPGDHPAAGGGLWNQLRQDGESSRSSTPADAPPADEGPFLAEERNLIDSLAEMLRSFLERRDAAAALQEAHDELEQRVAERTAELLQRQPGAAAGDRGAHPARGADPGLPGAPPLAGGPALPHRGGRAPGHCLRSPRPHRPGVGHPQAQAPRGPTQRGLLRLRADPGGDARPARPDDPRPPAR